MRVLACWPKVSVSLPARVFEVDPNTVLHWLVEAAEQLRPFPLISSAPCTWSSCNSTSCTRCCAPQAGEISDDEAMKRLGAHPPGCGRPWTPEQAAVGHRCRPPYLGDGAARGASGHPGAGAGLPRCFSPTGSKSIGRPSWLILATGFNPNGARTKDHCPSRGGCRCPNCSMRKSSKSYRRRRLVRVKHRVMFGTQLAIEQILAACGWTINTAFVERLNLDLRQRVAAIGRRVNTLCQGEAGVQDQLALFQVYHGFVLPHASLRQACAAPMATNGRGLAKMWRPCTPAMAAGLTDHVWSLKEVLLYRVPPRPQTQKV